MTTIAFDGKKMAADKRAEYGGCIQVVTKIHRVGGCLVGGAGEAAFINAMVDWVRDGRQHDKFPASQKDKDDWQPIMVVEPSGRILVYERTPHPVVWEREFAAIGSGKHYAMAAMLLGHNASVAVRVAAHFDPGTGNGVDELNLEADDKKDGQ